MAKLSDIIRRGTAANRPAAASVAVGTLYYSTDSKKIERSTGSAWEEYSAPGYTTYVVKSADESLNASTTLQADDELLFAVGANETWEFEFVVFYLGNTTGDFRCGLKFPTAPTRITYGLLGPAPTASGTPITGDIATQGNLTADAVSGIQFGADTVAGVVLAKGTIANAGNAGNVVLWWAQGTSDATNTTVKAGSYVRATRIS